ncbi:DUF58 domain-containing protein [Natronolimnohabitans sp. A-GB9]|uniref:DUF58 domain-containing protein n=1 Tax=Natronolimnohabitans sp. A-GB9 TaxID=3069757 RepID=UPI0027B74F2A|nr:DUF58 domain-containing protein [Natronolimnohabitans sp. A-GB9]MDQ2052622.1 DUF58 domain-containing protein [Natronolimnohabitans sp. A-GB9]
MIPTRRLWAVIALVGLLAVLGTVLAAPLLVAGAGLIGAWVVTQQYRFWRRLEATVDTLEIDQSVARAGVHTDETTPVTLTAARDDASLALEIEIEGGVPTAATLEEPVALSLEPGTDRAELTRSVSWPIAGDHRFDEPTVTAENGLLREEFSLGPAPTVTVDPRSPRSIHVGKAGDRTAAVYGEHDAGRLGTGLEPTELREYVPGDRADRIDWNATARLDTPYVRERESETDRQTLLLVDHRATLAAGHDGETKLDYLREVALAITATARRLGDPVGLLTVDDDGLTSVLEPATTPTAYDRVRRRLFDLEPSATDHDTPTSGVRGTRRIAADARDRLTALDAADDDTAFEATLQPFYATREGYRKRIESDPLYGGATVATDHGFNTAWTVICTDDSRPGELRETVKLAQSNGSTVLVLLAPTVLYECDGLADVDGAYERYLEFERLRHELDTMDRVTALEVGPRDRLSTLLTAGRTRQGGRA